MCNHLQYFGTEPKRRFSALWVESVCYVTFGPVQLKNRHHPEPERRFAVLCLGPVCHVTSGPIQLKEITVITVFSVMTVIFCEAV
ncbi:hypothetical protein Y032_0063g3413 [Ancylostoma ceylanicum]|uniref:Uncharacterized protein n=1 Tax=Ancylostoma ceylanicum TaxID=53326 RepID=A0A016U1Y5_9BILA|nr:hypothetical protein Y032_0063g3413 [Ancylostoma ceylanicum]